MTSEEAYHVSLARWWRSGTDEDFAALVRAWKAWERAPWEWCLRRER